MRKLVSCFWIVSVALLGINKNMAQQPECNKMVNLCTGWDNQQVGLCCKADGEAYQCIDGAYPTVRAAAEQLRCGALFRKNPMTLECSIPELPTCGGNAVDQNCHS